MPLRSIEVTFPVAVELPANIDRELVGLISKICDAYEAEHLGRVMWPFGIGCKPTFIPMTPEDERTRGLEFDETTFQIECSEREDYKWPCAKCGIEQGDHKTCITQPPAGDCDFEPAPRPAGAAPAPRAPGDETLQQIIWTLRNDALDSDKCNHIADLLSALPAQAASVDLPPFAETGYGSQMLREALSYLSDYVFDCGEDSSDHEPTEFERSMLEDFVNGLMTHEPFFGVVRAIADRFREQVQEIDARSVMTSAEERWNLANNLSIERTPQTAPVAERGEPEWQMVPKTLTREMEQAAIWALERWREKNGNVQERVPAGRKHQIRYDAILAAAPSASPSADADAVRLETIEELRRAGWKEPINPGNCKHVRAQGAGSVSSDGSSSASYYCPDCHKTWKQETPARALASPRPAVEEEK